MKKLAVVQEKLAKRRPRLGPVAPAVADHGGHHACARMTRRSSLDGPYAENQGAVARLLPRRPARIWMRRSMVARRSRRRQSRRGLRDPPGRHVLFPGERTDVDRHTAWIDGPH